MLKTIKYTPLTGLGQARGAASNWRYAFIALFFLTLISLAVLPLLSARAAEPLRVVYGFDREFPPFSYEEPGGKATGFEVELMEAVFNQPDVNLMFRPLQWEQVTLELSNGVINLTTGMVRTEQRAKLYQFSTAPTFGLQIRLFTKVYNRFASSMMLRGQTVAVEQGSYQHRLLESIGGFNIKTFPGRVDGLRALYNDEVAAYCAPVQNTYYYINKLNYGAITTVGTPLGLTEMRAAVARNRGDILRRLNEGLEQVIKSGEYDRLYRKWFVRELSGQERALMLQTATRAAIPAYVPYGKKGFGAAVLAATGKVYSACSVENADLALSLSAMRAAVARAIADGEFELRAAVLV
ncbi:MAG: transporter substrate-binding domain-containing protein, partial [Desulfovibrio sp.]|nr:transporter substrate-binding domain-containing protein [Desulfovibrio sp.]